MKKLFLIFLSFFLVAAASGQSQFLLYSIKGNVTVIDNKVESPAKVGNILGPTATVKIPSGGSVTIVCNEAAMFSLVKTGSYQLSKFGDSCRTTSNSSVSKNYIKYVWAQMTKSNSNAGSNRNAYMNTVGAVTRGDPMNNVWIDVRLDTINYSGITTVFPLSWKSYADAEEFEFSLYNSENLETPFFSTFTKKLKVAIPDFLSKIKPGNTYHWTASVKGETNETLKPFIYVTKEMYDMVLSRINALKPAGEAPAEEAYRTAFMLEDAHYLAEAYQYYTKAAQLDTTNVLYRSTLMSFKKDYEIK